MTIKELLEMFVSKTVQGFNIWNDSTEEVVFTGYLYELPDKYKCAEVTSIDNLTESGILTINIVSKEG